MTGPDDKDVWEQFSKGVKPISKKKKAISDSKRESVRSRQSCKKHQEWTEFSFPEVAEKPARGFAKGFLARHKRQIRELPVIDLHGFKVDKAYDALRDFIAGCMAREQKIVMVITGKGLGENSIAANFPRWIEFSELAKAVVSYDNAPPEYGGSGAWVLVLRKK